MIDVCSSTRTRGLWVLSAALLCSCPQPLPSPPRRRPARAGTPERMLPLPADLVKSKEHFQFLIFGDSRAGHSRCDKPRKHSCDIVLPGGAIPTREDCSLEERAPELMLEAITERLTARAPPTGPRDAFALFTGDLVFRGSCKKDWELVRAKLLSRIPARRLYPIVGNHESWHGRNEPRPLPFFFQAYPHLRLHVGDKKIEPHYYFFHLGRSLFINLCTGGYPRFGAPADFEKADRRWLCEVAPFPRQMAWLDKVLAYGARHGVRHVFVQYHKPSFSCSRHPSLDDRHDPMFHLRPFKKRHPEVNIIALSGHNHTTALYVSEGVVSLVAGGSGAPQHTEWGARACHPHKRQPPERFWNGARRVTRYNYFRVVVHGNQLTIGERCLTRVNGRFEYRPGAVISANGTVTHRTGACRLHSTTP
ncbi:MAG: metallophosphoesterase [bacterium]